MIKTLEKYLLKCIFMLTAIVDGNYDHNTNYMIYVYDQGIIKIPVEVLSPVKSNYVDGNYMISMIQQWKNTC